LVTVFAGFMYNRFKKTKKQKLIIEEKEKDTQIQKQLVEEKNKEILDSINYAKRLQNAILPSETVWKSHLPESFVLNKPKDIVAGDFFWLESISKTSNSNEELLLIAAADCTGHGVPGALVSVVCSNALNRAVKEFHLSDPGKILDKTRELVLETFEKSDEDVKDGMDISLCAINLKTLSLNWAGANNPLWLIQNGDLIQIKADKQPVGKHSHAKPFTTHNFQLKKNDSIYIFTDGFPDQFGGPKGKKFKHKQLSELILEVSNENLDTQKQLLDIAFENWKFNVEQIDDVCVIGIRI
jgi:serine phosphatase RsbU (regulator of sigma subunit)